jgi:23S rRNA pseudouridine2605 synthase
MRINRFIALATGVSRRAADKLADAGEIQINGRKIKVGQEVAATDHVTWRGKRLELPLELQTIIVNKPEGYVCSRTGQGSMTVYDLLPARYHNLKPIGRLDKASSGLLLMTNDGKLAQKLSHPSNRKMKCYEIVLDKPLKPHDWSQITQRGVMLDDGISKFDLHWIEKDGRQWIATLYEGRNRQIRRTFKKLGYNVTKLHRTIFGNYKLGHLESGNFKLV